jgi:hypothetical protein
MIDVSDELCTEKNTHIMFTAQFFRKSCLLDNVEKNMVQPSSQTDDNIILRRTYAICMLDTYGKNADKQP